MLKEHNIKLGPVRTRYFEGGKTDATPVVLIHEGGFGGDALNSYGKLVAHLADDYRLILPEMLGFGGTDKAVFFGENPYEPRLRHLAAFFDAIDLGKAHFVGNSFGGGMVLRLSLRSETAWRMLSATSISGTGGPFRTPEGIAGAFDYEPSIEAARQLDSWVLGTDFGDEAHARDRFDSSMRPGQWESMAAPQLRNPALTDKDKVAKWDLPEGLSLSQTRTLLIAGARDRMLEKGWEEKLAAHLKDGTTVRVDAAHSPNITHPEATAQILRRFFENNLQPSAGVNSVFEGVN